MRMTASLDLHFRVPGYKFICSSCLAKAKTVVRFFTRRRWTLAGVLMISATAFRKIISTNGFRKEYFCIPFQIRKRVSSYHQSCLCKSANMIQIHHKRAMDYGYASNILSSMQMEG